MENIEKDKKNKQVYLYFNESDNLKQNVFNHVDDEYYELLRDYNELILECMFRR
jgi:hypothetical protein